MSKTVKCERWREFFKILSQTLDMNITLVDKSGNPVFNTFEAFEINIEKYPELTEIYNKFIFETVKDMRSGRPGESDGPGGPGQKILSDPFGLLVSFIQLADGNYLILGGIQEKGTESYKVQFKKKLEHHGIYANKNIIPDNLALLSRKELISKTENAKKLYDQLLHMSRERCELAQKMMLLTAIEEYDKLLLSLIHPDKFNLKPILELITSSLIILFDAEGSWVFSQCGDQCFTAFRGISKRLLLDLSVKWKNISNYSKKADRTIYAWSEAEKNILLDFDSETTSLKSDEFAATLGLIKPKNNSVKEGLDAFSRMVTIALEMQSFFNTLHYRLSYLLKYLRHGIIIFNIHGNAIIFNQAAINFFDSHKIELIPGIRHNSFLYDKKINKAIENVIKNGTEHLKQQSCLETKINTSWLKWDVVPLKDENEKIKGSIMVFEDITEINKIKHQIQEQERKAIAGELAAGFAHEIRNPLSVAGGVIQLLDIVDDTDRQKSLIQKLHKELDRINQILTDFMDITKPNKKKRLEPIQLPEIINEIKFLIKSDANLNNIELIIENTSEDFPLIKGNRSHLKQVFLNIIKNAIEAMKDGGNLKINYYHNNETASIAFEDNGQGIPEEHLPLILKSFFTTKVDGTGLGLAVSSELIKNMGGELKIQSEPGKGTIVQAIFPVINPE